MNTASTVHDRLEEASHAGQGNGAPSSLDRRLVVVSNRIPLSWVQEGGHLTTKPSSGGLISALEPLLKAHGGLWVGSAGSEDSAEIREQLESAAKQHAYRYTPVFVTADEQVNYYEGFSNEVIWPLFHDLQSRCVFEPRYWDFYQRVNRKFAEAALAETEQRDVIWVHDYQLLQVAHFFREQRPEACVAFFLHIPFPAPDIFEKLPWRRQILEGLLDYDLIGVQTARDERNLIACLRGFLPHYKIMGRGRRHSVLGPQGETRIEAMPISIDYRDFARGASADTVVERMASIQKQYPGLHIAIGIDRLDYTKGIPERLRAFRALLRDHEEYRRKITLMQVVVPSRENIPRYQELRSQIEQLVSSINGDFSEPGWTPIEYMHHSVPREELLAMYRSADIALITPLKDGMNLVAKEYCTAHVENSGVLILSEFAGAAPELGAGAILVNPYDEVGVACALRQAIEMEPRERHQRMLRLRRQIRNADILGWRDHFFAALENLPERKAAQA
ncbi:Alpha,alpha-trehalose-phosphate synthase [UDP-forming] [Acidisarcina polymorpha]|uniref:Glucosylglycerol-phosphate synthase n=1 Tax=Acidisarcina polymorpha TaxID=2211140 RepID=A0A2Z5G5B7_9BACT|nr:trehalose-6-phosphate synthase [Acidisarcina polymorpha]AXC14139.1 Alpha,alpha-trehalose-phosphate synthase [UDP-forming] [Acidisarcina polymorpha]